MSLINLYVMVGIQGSGKSTYVDNVNRSGFGGGLYRFCADDFRKNFPDEDNEQIFTRLYYGLGELLRQISDGKEPNYPIYLDNTGITIKSRRKLFAQLEQYKRKIPGLNFNITALVMSTPFEICLERNAKRERVVPEEVIYRYRASFNIPFYEEGFNQIKIIDGETLKEITYVECNNQAYATKMYDMIKFDQENPHHKYTLGVHMSVCQNLVLQREKDFCNPKCMFVAAIVHDWGKFYTKTYNTEGNGIYYNHGEVGTYELLSHLELIPQKDFTMNEILRVLAYVNYHMRPFDWNSTGTVNKATLTYGAALVHDLCAFNEIDREACGTNKP